MGIKGLFGAIAIVAVLLATPAHACRPYHKTATVKVNNKSTGSTIIKDSVSLNWTDDGKQWPSPFQEPPTSVGIGHTCRTQAPWVASPGCRQPVLLTDRIGRPMSITARKTNTFVNPHVYGSRIKVHTSVRGEKHGGNLAAGWCEMDALSRQLYSCNLEIR